MPDFGGYGCYCGIKVNIYASRALLKNGYMKRSIIFIFLTFFALNVIGQTTEFSIHLNSGLFSFRGPESAKITSYVIQSEIGGRVTRSPFGQYSAFSYGAGFNAQRVTDSYFIIGIRCNYESLSSKIKIDRASGIWSTYDTKDSYAILNNQFLNLFPFLGNRIHLIDGIVSDLIFGVDIGILLNVTEHATVNTNEQEYRTSRDWYFKKWDYRLRFEFINYYKNWGLSVGYSSGLTNYLTTEKYLEKRILRTKMIRLGLIYKI